MTLQGLVEAEIAAVSVEVLRFEGRDVACLLDYDVVARLLGLRGGRSVDTVRRLIADGELPCVRVRGQVRFLLEDVLEYVRRNRAYELPRRRS